MLYRRINSAACFHYLSVQYVKLMYLNMKPIKTEVNKTKTTTEIVHVLRLLLTNFMWKIKTLKYVSAYKWNGNGRSPLALAHSDVQNDSRE